MSKQKHQKTSSRSRERAFAFQVLYSIEFTKIHSSLDLQKAYRSAPRVKVTYEKPVEEYQINQSEEEGQNSYYAPTLDSLPIQENDTIEDVYTNMSSSGFSWEIVEGVWTHVKELDATIKEYTKNWRIDRLGRIELTILRMALFEMLYRDDIPVKVSIAEALELTSQFAEMKASSFINGLLDAVHKKKLG